MTEQQASTKHLLCARHHSRYFRYKVKQKRKSLSSNSLWSNRWNNLYLYQSYQTNKYAYCIPSSISSIRLIYWNQMSWKTSDCMSIKCGLINSLSRVCITGLAYQANIHYWWESLFTMLAFLNEILGLENFPFSVFPLPFLASRSTVLPFSIVLIV